MRHLILLALLLMGTILSLDARAGATVDLLFVGRNGAVIAPTATVGALPGDTLTMAVRLRNDEAMLAATYSLKYDLDGDDELEVVSGILWKGVALNSEATAFFGPFQSFGLCPCDLDTILPTLVGFFTSFRGGFPFTPLPPTPGGYQMGTVVWKINAGVNSDGADIISGLHINPIDGIADGDDRDMRARVLFNSATVNLIPEPATASLLGLGLLALVLLRRRRS